jgi:hypothetical protein
LTIKGVFGLEKDAMYDKIEEEDLKQNEQNQIGQLINDNGKVGLTVEEVEGIEKYIASTV